MHDASRNGKKDVKISEHFSNLLRDMFVPQNYQNVPCLIYFLSVYNISIKVKSLSHSDFQTIHVPILGVVRCRRILAIKLGEYPPILYLSHYYGRQKATL